MRSNNHPGHALVRSGRTPRRLLVVVLLLLIPLAALAGARWLWPSGDLAHGWGPGWAPGPDWRLLTNRYDGVSLRHPPDWAAEILPGVATILEGPAAKLTVFRQPLDRATAREYVLYSNRSIIEERSGITLTEQVRGRLGGFDTWKFRWQREPLAAGDLHAYLEYHQIRDDVAYTFMLKATSAALPDAEAVLRGVLLSFEPLGGPLEPLPWAVDVPNAVGTGGMAVAVGEGPGRLVIPADRTMWGVMTAHKLGTLNLLPQVQELEDQLDNWFGLLSTYLSWGVRFDLAELEHVYDDGRLMLLAIQPWDFGSARETLLPALIKGEYDGQLRAWAEAVASVEAPVFVRFGNEMNGDWSTWCAWFYGKDADLFHMAWRHVVSVFEAAGAHNAVHVYNPHDRSFPGFKWNHPLLYYPGDDVVDWIGLTGYNNGIAHPGDEWREFVEIHDPLYAAYLSWWPRMPLMITEFASNENGGDKAAWIRDCFEALHSRYPRIKIAVWFDLVDGLWQYQLDSSEASLAAFREGLQRPEYQVRP